MVEVAGGGDIVKGSVASVAVIVAVLVSCAGQDPDAAGPGSPADTAAPSASVTATSTFSSMTIADVLRSDPNFSRFRDITERVRTPVAASALAVWDWPATELGDDGDGVTLFVPTDRAFEQLDPRVIALIDDPDVDNVLLYSLFGHHYVHRLYPSNAFEPGDQRTWRSSRSGPVQLGVEPLTWGGHPILQADIRASNGIIHVVGGVVIPDDLLAAAEGR